MADLLAAAKQLISARGVQPPAGIAPNTPQFDEWAQNWLQAAMDAGDEEAVKAAGGVGVADTEEGYTGTYAPWESAAPYTDWMGKRKPTPRELRKWAHDTGQSEDYARFNDSQVASWINDKWDVTGGHFLNDFGDVVAKPTESGPNSSAAGAATGEKAAGVAGGGGGGGAAPVVTAPTSSEGSWGALDQRMMDLFKEGAGYFDPSNRAGIGLQGGGLIWRDPLEGGGAPMTKGTAPGGTPSQSFTTNAINPNLVSATLNAFSPQAPSKQVTPTAPVTTPAPLPAAPVTPPATPVTTPTPAPVAPATQPTTGTSPLTRALSQKYSQPNSWWMGGQKNYSY